MSSTACTKSLFNTWISVRIFHCSLIYLTETFAKRDLFTGSHFATFRNDRSWFPASVANNLESLNITVEEVDNLPISMIFAPGMNWTAVLHCATVSLFPCRRCTRMCLKAFLSSSCCRLLGFPRSLSPPASSIRSGWRSTPSSFAFVSFPPCSHTTWCDRTRLKIQLCCLHLF